MYILIYMHVYGDTLHAIHPGHSSPSREKVHPVDAISNDHVSDCCLDNMECLVATIG